MPVSYQRLPHFRWNARERRLGDPGSCDEEYQPVPPGEEGAKVLVTNLANLVQPFIRYEVGDLVTMAAEPCECGSNLPLVARVGGRDSDIFYIDTESGRRPLHPIVFEHVLTHLLDAREYQIVQEQNTRFRIRLEPLSGAELDVEQVQRMIGEALVEHDLNRALEVDVELVDRLAAEDDQKFKRIVAESSQARPAADDTTEIADEMAASR